MRASPYHPQTNRLVERMVDISKRHCKSIQWKIKDDDRQDFLQMYRDISHSTTGQTPVIRMVDRRLRDGLYNLRPSQMEREETLLQEAITFKGCEPFHAI